MEKILERRKDIELISATHAALGLKLAEAQLPDLILLDINLPDMDGLTAFKKLQANEATRSIPVLALSADAMEADVQAAMELGMAGYLTKPIDVSSFIKFIDDLVSQSSGPETRV